MGIENWFLRRVPGLIFLLLGVYSQLAVGRRLEIKPRVSRWLAFMFVALYLPLIIGFNRSIPPPFGSPVGYLTAFLTLWSWVIVFAAIVLYFRNRLPAPFSAERRTFLNVSSAAICVAPAAALGFGIITRNDFKVREFDLKFPNLPPDLQGLRLLQLSDIHLGTFFSVKDLVRTIDASNNLRADLAFITGDLITDQYDPLDRCLLEIRRLRVASGIWGCLGNHEMHAKVEQYTTAQALKLDIQFLRHQASVLKFGNAAINLVGVDHQRPHYPYLSGVDQLVAKDKFNLLLSHNPDVFPVASQQGFDLTLAGHTHGGQLNFELGHYNLNAVDLVTPYTKGLYQRPASTLYVNSGLGTIGIPVRLGAPPEITLIRLCKS